MSKQATKALIDEKITGNGVQAITGPILNNVLNTMVDDYGTQDEVSQLAQELTIVEDTDYIFQNHLSKGLGINNLATVVSMTNWFIYYGQIVSGQHLVASITNNHTTSRVVRFCTFSDIPASGSIGTNLVEQTIEVGETVTVHYYANSNGYIGVGAYNLGMTGNAAVNLNYIRTQESESLKDVVVGMANEITVGTIPYYGQKITLGNKMNIRQFGESNVIYQSKFGGDEYKRIQGMCIAQNGYAFCFYDDAYIRIYDINNDCALKGSFASAVQGNDYHCAVVCFGQEIPTGYSYPAIYGSSGVGSSSRANTFWVLGVTASTSALLQTITVENDEIVTLNLSGVQCAIDNGYFYVKGRRGTNREMYYYQYRLPLISEGDVTLTDSDLIASYKHSEVYKDDDITGQDWKVIGGVSIYEMGSGNSAHKRIYFVEIASGFIQSIVDLQGYIGEPEGLDTYNKRLYVTTIGNYMTELSF